MIRLQDTLKLMHLTSAKTAMGDSRFGEWCKMTDTYVALKGGGKWYKYYFTNFGGAENPDFDTICKCFYRDSGCYPTAPKSFMGV